MSLSLTQVQLSNTVSEMVTILNSNSTATEEAVNGVPTYSQISRGSSAGLAPGLPSGSGTTKYLREDGTWQVPPNTTYESKAAASGGTAVSLCTTGEKYTWNSKVSCTTANVKSALGTGSGSSKYLREDGTWQTPPNTTYSNATTSSSGIVQLSSATNSTSESYAATPKAVKTAYDLANGKVSCTTANVKTALGTGSGTSKYLREDGTWQTPPNTTYSAATTSAAGLVSTGAQSFAGSKTFADTTEASNTTSGAVKISGGLGVAKNIYGAKVYNAVWNDYAECREAEETEAGRCITECKDGIMRRTHKRLQPGCKIVSDTFGHCMGETEKAKTPIGVAGRVLAYPYKGKKFKIGDAVCSAPDGTVDVMSRLEVILFPDRIVGTVSEIPTYEEWIAGTKENPQPVKVNGRVWVYVR